MMTDTEVREKRGTETPRHRDRGTETEGRSRQLAWSWVEAARTQGRGRRW